MKNNKKVGFIILTLLFFGVGIMKIALAIEDTSAPQITAFSITPTSFDTESEDQILTLNITLIDDISGVCIGNDGSRCIRGTQIGIASYDGSDIYPGQQQKSFYNLDRISGNDKNGNYTATVTIPKGSANGIWKVYFIELADKLGNFVDLDYDQLMASVPGATGATLTNGASIEENQPPILSYLQDDGYESDQVSPGVEPNKGVKNTTNFAFKVVYTDSDNDAPEDVALHLNSANWAEASSRTMIREESANTDILHDGNYANGELYVFSGSFELDGNYTYYFTTDDGHGKQNRLPESEFLNLEVVKIPIIIIPGIMGSELMLHQTSLSPHGQEIESWVKAWIPDISVALDDIFGALKMDENGDSKERIYASDILREDEEGKSGFYDPLIVFLKNNGYEEEKNLFVFPYDWRKDNMTVAMEGDSSLKSKIEEVIAKTHSDKVDIIAHSMGGLMAKYYMAEFGGSNVRKFIDIATPHLGAPKAFKAMAWGDNMGMDGFVNQKFMSRFTSDSGPTMPALYQLLPSKAYFENNQHYFNDRDNAENFDETFNSLQELGSDINLLGKEWNNLLHDEIDSFANGSLDTANYVGCGMATIGKISYDYGEGSGVRVDYINGDGTVPLQSAEHLASKSMRYHKGKHSDLPSNPDVLKNIIAELNNQSSVSGRIEACGFGGVAASFLSPITMDVYDSQGRHSGPDINGDIENNIPGVQYDIIDDEKFVFLPEGDRYIIKGNATDVGTFNSRIITYQNSEPVEEHYYNEVSLSTENATVEFPIVPDQTDYTMQLDSTGNGTSIIQIDPSSVLSASQAADIIPPATTVNIGGVLGLQDWHVSDISVNLTVTDDNSGVLKTKYSMDGGDTWNQYNNPIQISEEGHKVIKYYSIDKAGNYESIKEKEIKIDKTAPEAVVSPSLDEAGIEVDGTDNLSEVAVEQKNATEYVISDEAGNTAKLQFEGEKIRKGKNYNRDERIKKWYENNGFWKKFFSRFRFGKETNSEVGAKLKTVQYNDEPAIQLPNNRLHFVWKTSKKELITLLEQQLEVLGSFKIIGNYNEKKDETNILIHEKGKPKRETFDGLKILNMKTVKGVLQYDY